MSSKTAKRIIALSTVVLTCAAARCAPTNVIVIGDSIMATREINRAFDDQGYYVANLSSAGQQVANAWGLAEAANNIYAGNIVITLGYNDYAQGLPAKNFRTAYSGLLTRLKTSGDYLSFESGYSDRTVYCVDIFPNNVEQTKLLNSYRQTTRELCPNLIDHQLFTGLQLKDGVHPTPEGSEFIVLKMTEYLDAHYIDG